MISPKKNARQRSWPPRAKRSLLCACIVSLFVLGACGTTLSEDGVPALVANREITGEPPAMEGTPPSGRELPLSSATVSSGPQKYEVLSEADSLSATERSTFELRAQNDERSGAEEILALLPADQVEKFAYSYAAQILAADESDLSTLPPLMTLSESNPEELYWNSETMQINLPKRNLTSSELNSLALWARTVDEIKAELVTQADETQQINVTETVAEEEAIRWISGGFGADLRNYRFLISEGIVDAEPTWELLFFENLDAEENKSGSGSNDDPLRNAYAVTLSADSGKFLSMRKISNSLHAIDPHGVYEAETEEGAVIFTSLTELRNDAYWVDDAREFVEDVIRPDSSVTEAVIQRYDGDNQLIVRVAMSDRSNYRIEYELLQRNALSVRYTEPTALPVPLDASLVPSPSQVEAASPAPSDAEGAAETTAETTETLADAAEENEQESATPEKTLSPN